MDIDALHERLDLRWRQLFERLAAAGDVPPGPRLRAEGLMEAAALLEPGSEEQLTAAMASVYLEVTGRALDAELGADWRAFTPFPEIPVVMDRAPVYPTTRD